MKDINRFVEAQDEKIAGGRSVYEQALAEIRAGRKTSHWIWYIFPQVKGLGYSYNSDYYGIDSRAGAQAYVDNRLLHERLVQIAEALLEHDQSAVSILGGIDAGKVRSCATLFELFSPDDVFARVLDKFYDGKRDGRTLEIIDGWGE